MSGYGVLQIDHVELFVPDRHEAARWYERVLGLRVVPEFAEWARGTGGPLMIATHRAGTKLALFEGEAQGQRPTAGFHRVAFSVDARAFLEFVERLPEIELLNDRGTAVTPDAAVDHGRAFSIYFVDPYGHRLELTTYEHQPVRAALASGRKAVEESAQRGHPSNR